MKSRWRWDRVRDSRCRTGIASLPADPYRFRSDGGLRPMAYDNTDPRSLLAGAKAQPPVIDYADAATIEFPKIPPSETGPGYKTWYGRGQKIVLDIGRESCRERECPYV